jgi:hypothetical protein
MLPFGEILLDSKFVSFITFFLSPPLREEPVPIYRKYRIGLSFLTKLYLGNYRKNAYLCSRIL